MPVPTAEPLVLELKVPFRTAHGITKQRTNALVRVGRGFGEAGLPPYYPYRLRDIQAYVDQIADQFPIDIPDGLEHQLNALPDGPPPAMAAVDMAMHDRWGQHLGYPLYQLWGLSSEKAPPSSVTLSHSGDDQQFKLTLQSFQDWPVLKIKLGHPEVEQDVALIRLVKEASNARIGVDANGGWSLKQAAQIIPILANLEVLYIEQPIRSSEVADWQALRALCPTNCPPLIADESIQTIQDILRFAPVVDGVNIKLAKAGGLRAARQQVTLSRALGLSVMIGCMIESSVAVTAAAHLAPLADFIDLDALLHLADDPFVGVSIQKGRLLLPDRPGLGVHPR